MVQIFQDLQTYDMSFENVSCLEHLEQKIVLNKNLSFRI